MLFLQTASSRHDECLNQRSFKRKIGENYNNLLFIGAKSQILSSVASHGRKIPLLSFVRYVTIMLGKPCF